MDNKNVKARRRAYEITMRGLSGLCALFTSALVLFLIAYVLIKGVPNISWKFLTTSVSYLNNSVGILPDILNTLYIVLDTLLWVLPLGVGAAIYLTEYAKTTASSPPSNTPPRRYRAYRASSTALSECCFSASFSASRPR